MIQPKFVDKTGGVLPEVGDVYRFNLIATLRGDNNDYTDEQLVFLMGSVHSTNAGTGTCRGDLSLGQLDPLNPFHNHLWWFPPALADLDFDGDLDIGSQTPASPAGYMSFNPPKELGRTTGLPQELLLVELRFTLREIVSDPAASADTRLQFYLRETTTAAQCKFWSDGQLYINYGASGQFGGVQQPVDGAGSIRAADIVDPDALLLASTSLRGIVPTANDYFVHGTTTAPAVLAPGLTRVFAGTLSTPHLITGGIQIDPGAETALTGAASDPPSITGTIAIDPAAKFDLGDTDLVIASASAVERDAALAEAEARIASARNGGAAGRWSGKGITSSTLAVNSICTLALVPNDPALGGPGFSSFAGATVNINSILVVHALAGDFNLDGAVDIDDYFRIDSGYARYLTHPWQGDINYDGRIDGDDYFSIDMSFLMQNAIEAPRQSVPEPSLLAMLGTGGLILRRRRSSAASAATLV